MKMQNNTDESAITTVTREDMESEQTIYSPEMKFILMIYVMAAAFITVLAVFDRKYNAHYYDIGIYLLIGIYFFLATFLKRKLKYYLINVFIILVITSLFRFFTFLQEGSSQMAWMLAVMSTATMSAFYSKYLIFPVIAGYLLAWIYYFFLWISTKKALIQSIVTFILFMAFIGLSTINALPLFPSKEEIKSENTLKKEIAAKYYFARKLAFTINKEKSDQNVTTSYVIDHRLYEGKYTLKSERILDSYGGEVIVGRDGDRVSITYTHFPPGEKCSRFISTRRIDNFGFQHIEVDAKSVHPEPGNGIETPVKACYKNNAPVTISYIGSYTQISKLPSYTFQALYDRMQQKYKIIQKAAPLTREEVQKKYGGLLPPIPDTEINNKTLLGIDRNHNGVRDDVEWWIYSRYDQYIPCKQIPKEVSIEGEEYDGFSTEECSGTPVPYHPIVREIAMQFARAAQIVIQDPEKARQTIKYMHAAVLCDSYFEAWADHNNEPILTDHYIFNDDFKSIQFNTLKREGAFARYNYALSGGVYSANETEKEMRGNCDFNVDKLLKENP